MENTPKSTPQEPFALNVGGTSIWVLTGRLSTGLSTGGSCRKISAAAASRKTPIEGIKDFLAYLTSDSVQTFWHQRTGYLPTTLGAYRQTQASGFYQASPSVYMAVKQVIERPNQNLPNGIRLQNYAEIREKIIDAIEDVLLKGKPAQETLDQLVRDSDNLGVPGSDAPLSQ